MNTPHLLPPDYLNPIELIKKLETKPGSYWINKGEKRALGLFFEMAKRVPAYKDFLKKHKVNVNKIKSAKDFALIPPVDKENYLKKYPLETLCWDGNFSKNSWDISSTSGSTGKPFYFPRQKSQDWQYATMAEIYLRTNFDIQNKSTLYVNGFPLGIWIGGLFTYEAIKLVSSRGNYNLSIINPGIDKQKIIECITTFGKNFDQIIVGSYGPFLKDALDDGIRQGVEWGEYNLKFIFSAEGFTEGFRDYVIEKAGLKNEYKDTLNHYGTVDQGTHSYETPLSILIRRMAVKNKKLHRSIFSVENKLPTLTQYFPDMFYFETKDNTLLCSAYSGLPLFRYDLKDVGGIINFSEMMQCGKDVGVDFEKEMKKRKIDNTLWRIPFVYLYERNDFSVSLYAFQIYPSTVRAVLLKKVFQKYLTGKFTMMVKYNKDQNQYFEVNVELKGEKKENKTLKRRLINDLVNQLLKENSEYRETYGRIPQRIKPRVVFWPYEHPTHFKLGGKQKWVKKV